MKEFQPFQIITRKTSPKLIVISLGWGIQSWTLAAMAAMGELPPVDYAIHSDTTWEHENTYKFAQQWTPWLEGKGVKVVTVSAPEHAQKAKTGKTDMPAFTLSPENNKGGQLRRQCTDKWKIRPMRRFIADELHRRNQSKRPGTVEQWIGITLDEFKRVKDNDVQYIANRYPLLELNMTRLDCLQWLERQGLPTPGKSSCTFCPYHSVTMWAELKRKGGQDWSQAVEVDEAIRNTRPPNPLFVHPARKPLPLAVDIPEDHNATQLNMLNFEDNDAPCDSGHCFL